MERVKDLIFITLIQNSVQSVWAFMVKKHVKKYVQLIVVFQM
ncbi:uncharacterized protein METZ01_LOCUS405806, partial [marine metagenome]